MPHCPICDRMNPTLLCPHCSFDNSCDYEQYPTLGTFHHNPDSIHTRKSRLATNNIISGNHYGTVSQAVTNEAPHTTFRSSDCPVTPAPRKKKTRDNAELFMQGLGWCTVLIWGVFVWDELRRGRGIPVGLILFTILTAIAQIRPLFTRIVDTLLAWAANSRLFSLLLRIFFGIVYFLSFICLLTTVVLTLGCIFGWDGMHFTISMVGFNLIFLVFGLYYGSFSFALLSSL